MLVKKPEQLDEIDGLVIPGGESSTFLKLLGPDGFQKLKDFVLTRPSFGTCAGAILLAKEVENPPQSGLGAIDIAIRRNAYGRQIDSSVQQGDCTEITDHPVEMVFIRAPIIRRVGDSVRVLGRCGDLPVLVEQGNLLAATFHPELTQDEAIHRYFLKKLNH